MIMSRRRPLNKSDDDWAEAVGPVRPPNGCGPGSGGRNTEYGLVFASTIGARAVSPKGRCDPCPLVSNVAFRPLGSQVVASQANRGLCSIMGLVGSPGT
jgi:hypothetical protein